MLKCKICGKYLYHENKNRKYCNRCRHLPQANTNREEVVEVSLADFKLLQADSEDLKLIKEQLKGDHDQAVEWLKKKYGMSDD